MSSVLWVFLVHFPQPSFFVENFLPESNRVFLRINFLAIL